ncbi:MgtC/SapB family protein [Lysobacter hankyongensis]|uniref:MgtC/SapB family protein n=1 Tax=Lysobacter hankyongensis TaxID=1176535 RepID=A0ABP9C9E4_9GAMM
MPTLSTELPGFCVAFAVGLLIGIERERNKGDGPGRAAAGVRTFILVALAGAIAQRVGGVGIAIGGAFVALAALASYRRSRSEDPGLTTEVAMLVTFLLGVLAMTALPLAAGLGVVVAVVLASKTTLHGFIRDTLTEQELHDALLLAAAAVVVLPLLPDRAIDPWNAFNPHTLWLLVVLVMAINAGGYVALRLLGPGVGLALAGFVGGFVSSTATIAAMGDRARAAPQWLAQCVAAALLSNVATILMLAVVVGALSPPLLRQLAWPLAAAAVAAALAAASMRWRRTAGAVDDRPVAPGRPFEPRQALIFAAIVSAILLFSAGVHRWLGDAGVAIAAGVSGLADVHAATASVAQLVKGDALALGDAGLPVFVALLANSCSKLLMAWLRGGRAFLLRLLPGVVLIVAAFALGLWWTAA